MVPHWHFSICYSSQGFESSNYLLIIVIFIYCTCKQFDPWDVDHSLSLLESWAVASSHSTFKLAWETNTHLVCVTAKYCTDLTLLHIDNWHLFINQSADSFIPAFGGKVG